VVKPFADAHRTLGSAEFQLKITNIGQ